MNRREFVAMIMLSLGVITSFRMERNEIEVHDASTVEDYP